MNAIGCQEDAAVAYQIVHDQRDPRSDLLVAKGWKELPGGSFRSAWLAPSGVVYKVPRPPAHFLEKGIRHNRVEAENFRKWAGCSFVADWHLYEVRDGAGEAIPIMALEFVEEDGTGDEPEGETGVKTFSEVLEEAERRGTRAENFAQMKAALEEAGVWDLNPFDVNWRVRGDRAIVIDAGGAD